MTAVTVGAFGLAAAPGGDAAHDPVDPARSDAIGQASRSLLASELDAMADRFIAEARDLRRLARQVRRGAG